MSGSSGTKSMNMISRTGTVLGSRPSATTVCVIWRSVTMPTSVPSR